MRNICSFALVFGTTGLLFICFPVLSQSPSAKNYPRNYFRDPLNVPISLAANFGELRANHYHMGLDIRTEKRENLPVFAAAEGYIARVSVAPLGFGKAIYINHPNGYTTVYGHLNDFFPALAAYVKQQQYKKENWRIALDFSPLQFPVKKGELIAYSGNTGGSQGPHLHFEIRRTVDDTNINPLLFGLPIPDNVSPVIRRLAIYDGSHSIYEQSPKILYVRNGDGGFVLPVDTLLVNSPKVGLAISAFDSQSGSINPNGIYQADLYDDDQWVSGFQMDVINYENTRNINAHIDYKTKATGGPWLQQLFRLPGYNNSIYSPGKSNGVLDISDGQVHRIRVDVKDAYGNNSTLNLKLKYRLPNALAFSSWTGKMFYPQLLGVFETDDCAFYLGEKSLYDSVHINYSSSVSTVKGAVSLVYAIGEEYIPLQEDMLVRIRPASDFPLAKKDRVIMLRTISDGKDVRKVEWQNGWASARFGGFGNFQLILDEEPPSINPQGFKDGANMKRAVRIAIAVKDNLGAYKNFRAELDGKWLRFTNDKEHSFIYKFDEHCAPGKHSLKIIVEDEAGNVASRNFAFTR